MKNKSTKHWVVMAMLCGIAISAVGLPVMSNGVFITPIANSLGVYRGSVSMHNTLTLFAKAIISLYATVLLKKHSLKKLLVVGILLASGSNFFLGLTQSIWIFNILGTIRGVGAGMLAWVPVTIIINEWFEEKHGLVMSIVLSFSSVGGAIFSPIFTTLIENVGWELSYQIMGCVMLLFTLPALLVSFTVNPRESGYLPYGKIEEEPNEEEGDSKSSRSTVSISERTEVSGVLFALMFLFTLLQTMLIGLPQHFPGHAENILLSSEVGATMLSAAMISSILFKLAMGYVSDKIGPIKSTLSIIAIIAISSVLLIWTTHEFILYGAAILFGGIFAIPSVSVTLLTREFFGRYQFTRLYPILAFSTSIGGAVSLSLVGFIYDFTGSYQPAFIMALAINVFNFIVLAYMSRRRFKRL